MFGARMRTTLAQLRVVYVFVTDSSLLVELDLS